MKLSPPADDDPKRSCARASGWRNRHRPRSAASEALLSSQIASPQLSKARVRHPSSFRTELAERPVERPTVAWRAMRTSCERELDHARPPADQAPPSNRRGLRGFRVLRDPLDGKEGVGGSSPSEGAEKAPQVGASGLRELARSACVGYGALSRSRGRASHCRPRVAAVRMIVA